jgi:hypothetical protein
LRLHVPQTKQLGWPLGNAGAITVEAGDRGRDGKVTETEPAQRRSDVEAEAVGDDLDRDAGGAGALDERLEAGVDGLGRCSRLETLRRRTQHVDLELHQPPRADQAGVVAGAFRLPLARDELGHHGVGDVRLGNRAVEVDEERDRRVADAVRLNGCGAGAVYGAFGVCGV